MIKGILIDLGKTILTNEDFSFSRALKKVYDKFTYINNSASFDKYLETTSSYMHLYKEREETNIEIPFTKYISYVLNDLNINEYNLDEIEDYFLKHAITDNLIPGVLPFLDYTKEKNIPLVIVSNSTFSKRALLKELQDLKIDHYFKNLISSSDILYRKPHKQIFNIGYEALQSFNINKDEVIFVGNDYDLDILGSINAGFKACFYNVNNSKFENCFSFDDYNDLIIYINNLGVV